jgi:hypothetical protein
MKKMINLLIIPFLLMIYLSFKLGSAIGTVNAEAKFRHELWEKYRNSISQVKRV